MIDHLDTFLRLILPWEPESQNLYKSIMWKFPVDPIKQQAGPPLANYAAQDFLELKRLIQTRIQKPFHDVWICLATQRVAMTDTRTRDGFPKAIRQIPNLVGLKSIWLDIDVKPDAYPDQVAAGVALFNFIEAAKLPMPTMIVKSGSGGFHVYWCTAEQMTVDAWKVLALALRDAALDKGLMIDPQVTANAAGVLRVPTSVNWKSGTPMPVELCVPMDESFPVYTYAQLSKSLVGYIGQTVNMGTKTGSGTTYTQNFTAGLGGTAPPIILDDVAVSCPMTADALGRGGAGDPEPLWNLMMLMASFTDDPIVDAHRLSSGDQRYTRAETDRKIQEKVNARANNPNLGWPKCAQFAPLNPHCRTCPLLVQGKSPLNFAIQPQTSQTPGAPAVGDTLVPQPYWRDVNGHVWRTFTDDKGVTSNINMIDREIKDAFIDEANNQLVFKTVIMSKEVWAIVPAGSTAQTAPLIRALGTAPSGGINIHSSKHKKVGDFFVAWITHLQAQKKTISVSSYGWSDDMKAFTFGDKTFTSAGVERSYQGKAFNVHFREVGALKPWQDAMQLIYGKAALEIIVASSFAAPLTALLGSVSSVLSVYSAASGVGKSTGMKLAQAVWGHPISGMSSLDDTINSVKKKIADLKSLPAYWDELITSDSTQRIVDLVFAFTQGKAKSRLTANSEQMEANSFVTMFAIASNHGVGSRLYQDTSGTEAGGLRIFEVEANSHAMTHTLTQANQLIGNLSTNFGLAGAVFAEKLVTDRATVEKTLAHVAAHLDKNHGFDQKERYWRATMVVLLSGAMLANHYGLTTFDIAGMERRLGLELERQRDRLMEKADTTMSSSSSVLDLLNDLQGQLQGKQLVVTDIIPHGAGQPHHIQVIETDVTRLSDVWMQVGVTDGRIRMKARRFDLWLMERGQNPDNIRKMLGQHFFVRTGKLSIGVGVPMLNSIASGAAGRSTCIDLTPLTSHSATD